MKFNLALLLITMATANMAWGVGESMPHMPQLQPHKVYAVPTREAGEELSRQRGFGDQEPMVRMMNLMMVGGSGFEGMDMGEMASHATHDTPTHKHSQEPKGHYHLSVKINPTVPVVGANDLNIEVQEEDSKKPAAGLKIKAQVFMTSMDMGTEEPVVRETSAGLYRVKIIFSMKGPWAVKLRFPNGSEQTLHYDVGQ